MKKLKPHSKLFTKNEKGEYWQAICMICTGDVFSYKVDDVHYVFEDENLIGRPICEGCFEELKDKIPEKIDLIEKNEIEKIKRFTAENIFKGIEKTHQDPKKKIKDNLDKWILK